MTRHLSLVVLQHLGHWWKPGVIPVISTLVPEDGSVTSQNNIFLKNNKNITSFSPFSCWEGSFDFWYSEGQSFCKKRGGGKESLDLPSVAWWFQTQAVFLYEKPWLSLHLPVRVSPCLIPHTSHAFPMPENKVLSEKKLLRGLIPMGFTLVLLYFLYWNMVIDFVYSTEGLN